MFQHKKQRQNNNNKKAQQKVSLLCIFNLC